MFRFTIRDALWLTAVLAIGLAWWADRLRATPARIWELRAQAAATLLREDGWNVSWTDYSVTVSRR